MFALSHEGLKLDPVFGRPELVEEDDVLPHAATISASDTANTPVLAMRTGWDLLMMTGPHGDGG